MQTGWMDVNVNLIQLQPPSLPIVEAFNFRWLS